MITNDELHIRAEDMHLGIMWRNPLALVRAHLRARERSDPYYRWAEQAKKIRARHANWDATHFWAADMNSTENRKSPPFSQNLFSFIYARLR